MDPAAYARTPMGSEKCGHSLGPRTRTVWMGAGLQGLRWKRVFQWGNQPAMRVEPVPTGLRTGPSSSRAQRGDCFLQQAEPPRPPPGILPTFHF